MAPVLRDFVWRTDRHAVLSFQKEVYETNFPGFRISQGFLRDYEQQLKQALRQPGERIVVMEEAGEIVGFIWLSLMQTMVEPLVGYIKNIYVAPAMRCRGCARMLLDEADRWFISHGCKKSGVDASVCNPRAIAVYEAAGYQPTRYRMEKCYGAGPPDESDNW